jgi:dolichol-phosphate mannosyltransferase
MLYLLLAAYNEENDLGALLRQVEEQHWAFTYLILLVNDGSVDGTRSIAERFSKRLPLTLINHERNRGLGAALLTGFTAAAAVMKEGDLLVTMDADATHPPELVPALEKSIAAGSELVIASRFCPGGTQSGLSIARRTLSAGAGFLFSLLCPLENVRDYTSGFRAYSGKLVKMLAAKYGSSLIEEQGFAATLELLLKSSIVSHNITEKPLCLEYGRKTGASKMRILKTMIADIRVALRMRRFLTK